MFILFCSAALEEAKIQVSVQESGGQTEQPQNVQPAQNFEDLTGGWLVCVHQLEVAIVRLKNYT